MQSPSERQLPTPGRAVTVLLLTAILIFAAYLRSVGLDWDEGKHLHPDERFLSMVEGALDPAFAVSQYLDTLHSPLNPNNRGFGFFVYGNFPVVVVQYLGVWFERPGNNIDRLLFGRDLGTDFGSFHLLGRGLSGLCDVIATLLVFVAGTRLYGRMAGLLAAALYAAAVLPIQQAHFFTVDAIANLFVITAFWLAVRATESERWLDDVLFGVALGAGLASKLSIVPVALLLILAVVVRFGVRGEELALDSTVVEPSRRRRTTVLMVRAALSVNAMLLAALLTFRVLQPYAFLPPFAGRQPPPTQSRVVSALHLVADIFAPQLNPLWLDQMAKVRALQSGNDDSPPNHQWAMRTPLAFPWLNLVRFGLGWPLGLLAWIAWCWALVEGLRGRSGSWRHVLPVAWVGLYFAWYGAGWVTTMRYFLPLYPVLTLLAGWVLVRTAAPEHDASRPGAPPAGRWRRLAGVAAAATVLLLTFAYAIAFTQIYTRPHPRLAASRWFYAHVPADLTLLLRTSAGDLTHPLGLPNDWLPPGSSADDRTKPTASCSQLVDAIPREIEVHLTEPAVFEGVRLNDVDPPGEGLTAAIDIDLVEAGDGATLSRCHVAPITKRVIGVEALCEPTSVPLLADHKYKIRLTARGTSLLLRGSEIANEGHWDDGVPIPLPGYEPWQALYQVRGLEVSWEDHTDKRQRFQYVLDSSDYLTISSNRFYDSLTRNPRRWPMTIDYYRALFSGALGFELVADFSSLPCLGPWCVDDRDAEEAFSVYDHPRVMVFHKTAAYSSTNTASILGAADLPHIERLRADHVSEAPVHLVLPRLSMQ